VRWRYEHPVRKFPFYASPAVADGLVVIGGRDKIVHGLDAATGQAKWTYAAGSRIDSSTVITGERAFLATTGGEVLALDLATGERVWTFESGSSFTASPAVAQGRLVISSLDGMVYAFGDGPASPQTKQPPPPQPGMGQGYDVNFVLDGEVGTLRRVATLRAPDGARSMEVWTTEPGLQLYTGDNLHRVTGKRGAIYGRYAGLCLETQHFPDSIHHEGESGWPTIVLRPGETYRHVTVYRFDLG
jgi:hypothetical protein